MTGQEDSKFGFSLASGAAGSAVEALRRIEGIRSPASTPMSAARSSGSTCTRERSPAGTVSRTAPGVRALHRRWSRRRLPQQRAGTVHGRMGGNDPVGLCEPGSPHRPRDGRAGSLHRGDGRDDLYRVGTVKVLEGLRTYVSVDGGMSDNPRPVLYGSGYEAFLPGRRRRVLWGAPRGKALRVGRRTRRERPPPERLVVGDVVATPVTGAYGYAMASNYNRLGGRRGVRSERQAGWWSAGRRSRTCSAGAVIDLDARRCLAESPSPAGSRPPLPAPGRSCTLCR